MVIDVHNYSWSKSFDEIRRAASADAQWSRMLGAPGDVLPNFGIHLGVFVEPFLGYVLDGTKTVESRFSVNRTPPYGKVNKGDIVLLKQSGGPVVGLAQVKTVWSYHLDDESWRCIRERFADALRVQDPSFWELKASAEFATLMAIRHVLAVDHVAWAKKDRRGWVVVKGAAEPTLFRGDDDR